MPESVAELHAAHAAGESIDFERAFAAWHHEHLGRHSEPPLADAVNAWQDARQALAWALKAPDGELELHGVDRLELRQASALAIAMASRELARHHDDTLSFQLGLPDVHVRKIRRMGAGRLEDLEQAHEHAKANGRELRCSDLAHLEPACGELAPMLAPGVKTHEH